MRWTLLQEGSYDSEAYRGLGVSDTLCKLLWNLGLRSGREAKQFLDPRLKDLGNPAQLKNIDAAVQLLLSAIADKKRILVSGDYDVDGVTSTTLMVSFLRQMGGQVEYVVPRRLDEGYGMSEVFVDRVLQEHSIDLFVALDCGTNSVEQVERLKSQGIEVVIIDHHQLKDEDPADAILINPHVNEPEDKFACELCTVGLVFKFVHACVKHLKEQSDARVENIRVADYLDLVAMGTIADMVPLRNENRIFARYGLDIISQGKRPGLAALLDICGIDCSSGLSPTDISFKIGPRINASGRLADAALPVEMLLGGNRKSCSEYAQELDELNKERQDIERQIVEEATHMAKHDYADDAGLVLYGHDWHPGVVGIVAGKLAREFNKPCIVLGREGTSAKGSSRASYGVNLVEMLSQCASLLDSWGGHPMAAGVSLQTAKVEAFRAAFNTAVQNALEGGVVEPELELALWLDASELHEDLFNEMDRMGPFGQQNQAPIFGLRVPRLAQEPSTFGKQHFRFQVPGKGRFNFFGVAWRMGDRLPPADQPIEMAVKLEWNFWNGRRYPQLHLLDWRYPVQ